MPSDTQKAEEAKRLILEAALDCTNYGAKMRRAVVLHYCHGLTQSEAARAADVGRQDLNKALRRVAEAQEEVERFILQQRGME